MTCLYSLKPLQEYGCLCRNMESGILCPLSANLFRCSSLSFRLGLCQPDRQYPGKQTFFFLINRCEFIDNRGSQSIYLGDFLETLTNKITFYIFFKHFLLLLTFYFYILLLTFYSFLFEREWRLQGNFGSWFFLVTMWIGGIELRSRGLAASSFTWRAISHQLLFSFSVWKDSPTSFWESLLHFFLSILSPRGIPSWFKLVTLL